MKYKFMDYKEAMEILEIDFMDINYINSTLIKKQYRKLALKNHPDKNGNTIESKNKFQKISEAYHYLKKIIPNNHNENNEEEDYFKSTIYFDLLQNFIKTVFQDNYNDYISLIINEIINTSKKITASLFDNLSKEIVLNIYNFLSSNRNTLNLSNDILLNIREILEKKYDNVEIYKLNPSIDDLLLNNIYKLYINNNLFLVPLWHNESYFDSSNCEIIVICEPELPANIKIDDENNLHIEIMVTINEEFISKILNNENIIIPIGSKQILLPISQIFMKKEQIIRIKKEGLSKIKKDIYDIEEKTDIIIKLIIN